VLIVASCAPSHAEILFTATSKGLLQDMRLKEHLYDPKTGWTSACYDLVELRDVLAIQKSRFCKQKFGIRWKVADEQTRRLRSNLMYSRHLGRACEGLYVFTFGIDGNVPVRGERPEWRSRGGVRSLIGSMMG